MSSGAIIKRSHKLTSIVDACDFRDRIYRTGNIERAVDPATVEKSVLGRSVIKPSHDLPGIIDTVRKCRGRAGDIEESKGTVWTEQKTLETCETTGGRFGGSHDLARVVDPRGLQKLSRSRWVVNRGECPPTIQKTLSRIRTIEGTAHDLASVVDAQGGGLNSAWSSKGGKAPT